jgi:hypothetical protein
MAVLRPLVNDEQSPVLRVPVDRRRSLGEEHTRVVAELHQLLLELIPGGAKKDLSAAQAWALLAKVRPRDVVGKTRRRVAAVLVSDLERVYARTKAANKELTGRIVSQQSVRPSTAKRAAPTARDGGSSPGAAPVPHRSGRSNHLWSSRHTTNIGTTAAIEASTHTPITCSS